MVPVAVSVGASLTGTTCTVCVTLDDREPPEPVLSPSLKVIFTERSPAPGSVDVLANPNASTSWFTSVDVANDVSAVTDTEAVPRLAIVPTALTPSISVEPLTVNGEEPSSTIPSPVTAPAVIAIVTLPPAKLAGLSTSLTAPVDSSAAGAPPSV